VAYSARQEIAVVAQMEGKENANQTRAFALRREVIEIVLMADARASFGHTPSSVVSRPNRRVALDDAVTDGSGKPVAGLQQEELPFSTTLAVASSR
jgi:hypothetical protein